MKSYKTIQITAGQEEHGVDDDIRAGQIELRFPDSDACKFVRVPIIN
jgi:hypothetical protein